MIDAKYLELINRDIDGAISPEEREALRGYLAVNAAARQYHDDLVKVSAQLRSIPKAEPPAELRPSIMAEISRPKPTTAAPRPHGFGFGNLFGRLIAPTPTSWIVSGAAIGALGMFLVLNVVSRYDAQMTGQVGGTIMPIESSEAHAVDAQTITAGTVAGAVSVFEQDDKVLVSIQLSGEGTAEVQVTFDSNDLRMDGFTDSDGGITSYERSSDAVTFGSTSDHAATLTFSNLTEENTAVRVNISQRDASSSLEVQSGTGSVHKSR